MQNPTVGDGPKPGTREDLAYDAHRLGLVLTDRQIEEDHRRGLLATATRVSLGQGLGQARATYTSQQRAVYQAVLRNRAAHPAATALNRALACVPLHAWLYCGEEFVDLDQVRRAAATRIGNPKRSLRDAEQMARDVLNSIDLHNAPAPARAALRRELTAQLNTGRIDTSRLTAAVGRVFEPRADLHLIRGVPGVTVTVDNIVGCLHARMTAVRPVATGQIDDDALRWARQEFAASWPDCEATRAKRAAHAAEDLHRLFREMITRIRRCTPRPPTPRRTRHILPTAGDGSVRQPARAR